MIMRCKREKYVKNDEILFSKFYVCQTSYLSLLYTVRLWLVFILLESFKKIKYFENKYIPYSNS